METVTSNYFLYLTAYLTWCIFTQAQYPFLHLILDSMLRDYWTYEGSLTSPPCSEKVIWIILRYPLTMSNSQVNILISTTVKPFNL